MEGNEFGKASEKTPGGSLAEGVCTVESLLGLASCARFFCAMDGRFHACVPVNGRQDIVGLESTAFRDWLVDRCSSEHRKLPRQSIVRQAIEALGAGVRFEAHRPPVHIRVGSGLSDDAIERLSRSGRLERKSGQDLYVRMDDRRSAKRTLQATARTPTAASAQR